MNEPILLSPPHMTGNEQKFINEAFQSNWIAPAGPNINKFEEKLAAYVGTNGAVAVSSGTAAIHLALNLMGVEKGDLVFCSSLTFVASANPILYLGATPVFIDSEDKTWNMSPVALKKAMVEAQINGKLPKAVIVVNLYGQSAMIDELRGICDSYSVSIIEDAAESLGSLYKGKQSGSFGRFGIFSFNGNKIITTSGGGMLVSDDLEALAEARFLATQAKDIALHYEHSVVGYNYRMSNVLAGIGLAQLDVLDNRVEMRREVFNRYVQELGNIEGIEFMPELANTFSNRWLTTLTLNPNVIAIKPTDLIKDLKEAKIEARHIWKPLHLQLLFKGCLFYPHDANNSVSERLFMEGICLPSGSNLTTEQQSKVIEVIKQSIKRYSERNVLNIVS